MPRKPKNQNQSQDQNGSNFLDDQVNVDVEPQEETQPQSGSMDNLLLSASQNLSGQQKGSSRTTEWRKKKRSATTEQQADVTNFVIMLLTLILSALQIPGDLKPNQDEINAFAVPATKMLMRHTNITGKYSQDALDLIGMIAAISAYSVRTNAGWKQYRLQEAAKRAAMQDQSVGDVQGGGAL